MKTGAHGLSRPQWAELERLVREGGAEWYGADPSDKTARWPVALPYVGRGRAVVALERRGYVQRVWCAVGFGLYRESIEITAEGRAALGAHQARRGHPVPDTWRRRPKVVRP